MFNGYEFLKYKPEAYKQLSCKGMTFVYYDCPQVVKRVNIFTHYNILAFIVKGTKIIHRPGQSWLMEKGKCYFFKKGAFNQERYLDEGWQSMNFYIPDSYLQQLSKDYFRYSDGKTMPDQTSDQVMDESDVRMAVTYAHESDLRVAVRGGGQNGAGLGVCDDGLVIDLFLLKNIERHGF